mgnify:CR=1 FL=1
MSLAREVAVIEELDSGSAAMTTGAHRGDDDQERVGDHDLISRESSKRSGRSGQDSQGRSS